MATGVEQAGTTQTKMPLKRPYIPVFIALGLLTLVEVQIPGMDIAKSSQIFLLMIFAIGKAALVVLYYMHVRYEPRALAWIALVPLFLAIAMLVTFIGETI
ncbi:MAG: cytochrome C oxidase subunit IV family protein [Thermoplasmata archaeon]